MTKATAKLVVAALIEANESPTIHQIDTNNYEIRVVSNDGTTSTGIASFESTYGITGKIKVVEFN